MKKKGCLAASIIIGLFAFGLVFGIVQMMKDPDAYNTSNEVQDVDLIVDASQFSRITSAELVNVLGEPNNIENWNYKITESKSYDAVTYTYQNDQVYEFMLIDDQVVRFTIDSSSAPINFKNEGEIFPMFGITPSENLKKIQTAPSIIRYHLVSNKIAEVWIPDVKDESFGMIKFTYNLNYFD